jgi:Predicted membrane protein
MNAIGPMMIELSVGLFGLLLLTKVMGRASMSEATPFDFISMIVVGDFVSDAIYDPETHIFKVLFAIFFWGLLIYLVDLITLKMYRSRTFFESQPLLVINQGNIDRNALKKAKMDMNHLQMLLRDREIFSIKEVSYAILEPNGKVSVIRNPDYEKVSRSDLHLTVHPASMPVTFISDGEILKKNLEEAGKSEEWLINALNKRSIDNPNQIMIAEWEEKEGLFIQKIQSGS